MARLVEGRSRAHDEGRRPQEAARGRDEGGRSTGPPPFVWSSAQRLSMMALSVALGRIAAAALSASGL